MLLATAIAGAIEQVFRFLNSEAGQATAKAWLANSEKARDDFGKIGAWFENLFAGRLLK
jgi:hypothetical protein